MDPHNPNECDSKEYLDFPTELIQPSLDQVVKHYKQNNYALNPQYPYQFLATKNKIYKLILF